MLSLVLLAFGFLLRQRLICGKRIITGFRYRDKTNIHNWKTYKIFKKSHYQNVAATYYAFEKLIDGNKLLDKKSCCFYQRKRAETRSKGVWEAIPGYLAEWCFGYGEYPGRSILSLIGVILLYAPLYMLSGFSTGTRVINYTISCDFTITWDKLMDFWESVYFRCVQQDVFNHLLICWIRVSYAASLY